MDPVLYMIKDEKDKIQQLSDDLIISIIEFNISNETKIQTMFSWRIINKQFYYALNPNKQRVNMMWRQIYFNTFDVLKHHSRLKMKRWDQYLRYKVTKISQHRNSDPDYKLFSGLDRNDSIIVNCENDIEEINNLHLKIFQDKIGKNGLPDNYEWQLKCPVLSDKLEYVDDTTKYCAVCKENVYEVHTIEELKKKVDNKQCVSIVIYSGLDYYQKQTKWMDKGKLVPRRYRRNQHEKDPYKELRESEDHEYAAIYHKEADPWYKQQNLNMK